jgi:DNA-binding response OmpR family regulator
VTRIAIVEDEPDITEVVRLYLERVGYAVSAFADRLAAQDAFALQIPDLVILDVMLPGMDGFTLTRYLR